MKTLSREETVVEPKPITEETTLAELREQLLLFNVIALRIHPPLHGKAPLEASLHHRTGFHVGLGATEATAIEAAFISLRRAFQLRDEIKNL